MAVEMNSEKGEFMRDALCLSRFLEAQDGVYGLALAEIQRGKKQGHWMWFIFPQIRGLGTSATARHYAITSKAEAAAYLCHPILGQRLLACCSALMSLNGKSATDVFGFPDDLKLRSCLTLFSMVAEQQSLFSKVLSKYYAGVPDDRTLEILGCAVPVRP